MNTVVNKLLNVDKNARGILEEAQRYYDETIADIETERKKIEAEHEKKAQEHYKKIEEAEYASIIDAEKEIKETYARLTSEMDEAFEKEHLKWEDEIFSRCVGALKE